MPPSTASTHDSVSSCIIRWRRLAPIESRTAISVARPAPLREEEIGDVGAGNHQHDPGDGQQEDHRHSRLAMDRALAARTRFDDRAAAP